jgi:hypothetical protein
VSPITTGTIMRWTNLMGRHVKPFLRRAGLPAIRLHDLQHTYATIFLVAGKHPKYVQELPGHASINITLDPSSHVSRGWTAGSETLWTTPYELTVGKLLLPHCCHWGFRLEPGSENTV